MTFQTVIVTGGSGFIGSHLVDALVPIAKKVIVVDKEKPPRGRKNPGAKYKILNIQDEALVNVFQKHKPDVVFHLAAHIHDRESVHEPVLNALDNVIGSLRVFEAARLFSKKIIFASTGVTYGAQKELPIPVDASPRPTTPYAISKLTGERYLSFYKAVYDTPSVTLRMGNVYGPRQDASAESGAIGIFASRLLRGEQTYMNNDGLTTRDYVYVEDVVKAFLLAAQKDATGVFNVGTGIGTSTIDIYKYVRDAVGAQTEPDHREEVVDVIKHVALDISQTKKVLGWSPEVVLKDGIERTVDWYSENI